MELLTNYPSVLVVMGIVLITLEIVVFGFSTIFLVFIGLACFVTAALIWLGILPSALLPAMASVAIFTFVFAVALWKPFRRLQNTQQDPQRQPSSLEGVRFRLPEDLALDSHTEYKYSGITWKVFADGSVISPIKANTEVEVSRAGVGKLYVKVAD